MTKSERDGFMCGIVRIAEPKFELGDVVMTQGASDILSDQPLLHECLVRHAKGDWGDLSDHDRKANDEALKTGERIFSAYTIADDKKIWIITEADRSVTTFLLPEEY